MMPLFVFFSIVLQTKCFLHSTCYKTKETSCTVSDSTQEWNWGEVTSPKGLLELVTQAVWCHIRWSTEKFPNPPCYGKEASLVLTAEMDLSHLNLNIYSLHLRLSPKSFLLHGKKQRRLTDSLCHSKQASKTGLINCSLEASAALGWEPTTSSADVCPSGIQREEAHAGSCKGWGQPLNLTWGFQKRS